MVLFSGNISIVMILRMIMKSFVKKSQGTNQSFANFFALFLCKHVRKKDCADSSFISYYLFQRVRDVNKF